MKADVVRSMIDAWNGGGLDDVSKHLAEGIEWREVDGSPEFGVGEVRGKDDVQTGFEALFESWQSYRLELEDLRDAGGDRVVAIVREVARGRASGAEVAGRWGYVITVRGEKIERVEAYRDPSRAIAAAG
jgi:ketosteroid isomerase-like protein